MLRNLLNRLAQFGGRAPGNVAAAPEPAEQIADRLIEQGNRAEQAGQPEEASGRYRAAVEAAPRYAKAHLNLGIGLEACGNSAGAVAALETAIAVNPADPYAHYNLGRLLLAGGQSAPAEEHLRAALDRKAEFPEALIILSGALDARGETAAAGTALESALRLRPDDFGAWYHYGLLLKKLDRTDDAETALRRAQALDAENPDANYELAILLMAKGAMLEAGRLLRAAAARRPDAMGIRAALFHLFDSQGDLASAASELAAALKIFPQWVDAHYNYGLILKKQQKLDEAEAAFRRALAIDPAYFRAEHMLGSVLLGQSRVGEALELYRSARGHCPDSFELESAELFGLNCHDGVQSDELFARHRAFGVRIESAYPSRFEPFGRSTDPARRLRIGYVSGDFCYHVVTLFLTPVLERHDRSAFETYCYSTGSRVDEFTRRLAGVSDVWRDAGSMSERELADLVHRDEIDILIDLAGHSGIPNLALFAQRPAPVQATWLGYLNSTGMTRMHYRITDRYSDPPGVAEPQHTERLAWLPRSQWCYRPFIAAEPSAIAPVVSNGFVTFGSFNQASKLSRSVRLLWARILVQLPNARLVVVGVPDGHARRALLDDLMRLGVDPPRVSVRPYLAMTDYFRAFDAVDIALDTLPYSGGTTTCDALWMGVPVITLPGSRSSSRSAASILSTAGLPEWIAQTPDEYVGLAVGFARDAGRVAKLRKSLRGRLKESPLMDELQFTRDLEAVYREMWRTWCEGSWQ